MKGHRVLIRFDDGVHAHLIHPEKGCESPHTCGECGRTTGEDPEAEGCVFCQGMEKDECWLQGWFDNVDAEELLHGEFEVPVEATWNGDFPEVEILTEEEAK